MAFNHRLLLLLCSFAVLLILSYQQWQVGASAVAVAFSLATLVAALLIWQHCSTRQRQTALVLKALANQDTSLNLRDQPELQQLLARVQQQLGDSRQQAEAKAQYLHTLLSQLDVAVLEFAADGQLLQANPAAQRLLTSAQQQQLQQGKFDGANLAQLATLLQRTNTSYQGQLQWQQQGHTDRLALSIVCSRIQGQLRKLVTLQSINQALLQQEIKAYQQLTQVLTHEIANSVTPMASLAQSCQQILPQAGAVLTQDEQADLSEAFSTIERRGQHLANFILSFKQLSQPVQADLQQRDLAAIVKHCLALQRELITRSGIQLAAELPAQALLWLDEALMEQVLINLLQNALDAMQHSTEKQLRVTLKRATAQQWQLEINDSGPGIAAEVAEQIFIPFFTTKATGSGIGLPLSRALLQAQGAQLEYKPADQGGSCFSIRFGQ